LSDDPGKEPASRRINARRTKFGKKAVRRGRASSHTRARNTTVAHTEYTYNTATRGVTNTRRAIVGDKTGFSAELRIAWAKTQRVLRRRYRKISGWVASTVTGLGISLVVVVALAFLGGYPLAWTELVVVAWIGLVLLILATLFLIGRNSYDIRLSMTTDRVVVGDTAQAEMVVHNPGRLRLPSVRAEIAVGLGLAEFSLPGIKPKGSITEEFTIPTQRRGVLTIGPVRTIRADPVGLLRREYIWTSSLELYVHPQTISIPSTSTGLVRDLEGNPTRDLTNSDISFHALREYAPGDDRRYIHWKSTAKTGTLMVRQFEETRRSQIVIALSLSSLDFHSEEEFELAVSAAGSLGVRAIRDARDVTIVASEVTPEFARRQVHSLRRLSSLSPTRLLDDLAGVDHHEFAYRLDELARISTDSVTGISVAFMVCGSEPNAAELRSAATKFPLGVQVIAVVCNPGIVPSFRRIGDLSVMTIGYLDDLQKSLARSAA
jgi:uncharacterized protein (DUF58 family)